jgi:hypothetical protein
VHSPSRDRAPHQIGPSSDTQAARDCRGYRDYWAIWPRPSFRTRRGAKTPWKTFLAAHWDGLAAADFFTVEVVTLQGLVRYVVLFVMKLKTRTVEIAGMTSRPDETWMM